jgi:hypothetical protein
VTAGAEWTDQTRKGRVRYFKLYAELVIGPRRLSGIRPADFDPLLARPRRRVALPQPIASAMG